MGFLAKILGVDSDQIAKLAPVTPSCCDKAVDDAADFREKVEVVLEQIRPALHADGGDIRLVEVIDTSIRVKLVGACDGCPSAALTLRHGIEKRLREAIPEFEDLIPF